jgi:phosphoglycolate phosphatase
MEKKLKYPGIIFDLDGTLLDTIEDLADSMNQVLMDLGFPTHTLGAYKYFVGEGVEALIRRALPDGPLRPELLDQCLGALREEYSRRWKNKTRPYPGIPELLDHLTGLGFRMAILSNKLDHFTQIMVAGLLPRWRFEPVFGARPTVPRKPDPAGALEIAEALCLAPEQFIYLGDTGIDMKTASAAGMTPVGVLWGFRPADELSAQGARWLIEKPGDLVSLLA